MYIYYVYAYLRASDNSPYYIGKGKGTRYKDKHPGVSVPKNETKIVFLETNLSNIGACALERRYIRWYGRKDIGTGILLNKTEGGDGNTGTRTESWRKNHSLLLTGKKLSEEHISKLRKIDRSYMKTDDYKEKVSKSKKGKKRKPYKDDEGTRKKISISLSLSKKGKPTGRKMSDEQKEKMIAGRKRQALEKRLALKLV